MQKHATQVKPVKKRFDPCTSFVSSEQRDLLIRHFLESLDTPVSLGVWLRYRHKQHADIANLTIDPHQYNDAYKFRDDFAAVSLLRKATFLDTGIDKKSVALEKFRLTEEQCADTNRRLANLDKMCIEKPHLVSLLTAMTRKIGLWLEGHDHRPLEGFCIDEMLESCRWGPGVTQDLKGSNTSASLKFEEEHTITSGARRVFLDTLKQAYPNWVGLTERVIIRDVNVVITVPKDAKTDRTIAVEPGLNSWIQLGLGKMLRRRISRQGYDLNSTAFNSGRAREGSIDGKIVTVDFSSASDTISRELVRLLLPWTWFQVLDCSRSPGYTLNDHIHTYEKFSAMGCGFTWELECLIFLSAALCCCEVMNVPTDKVGVFGDDITIPREAYPLYVELAAFLGFTVNTAKSYSTSYFRESCGSYYFKGIDCKPIFLKKDITNVPELYNLANRIRDLAHRRNSYCGCDDKLHGVWSAVVVRVPKFLRFLVPQDAGQSGIHSNLDESMGCPVTHLHRDKRQWDGFHHKALVSTSVNISDYSRGHLLAMLHRLDNTLTRSDYQLDAKTSGAGNLVPLRGKVRTRVKRVFSARWHNFGPWF